MTLPLLGRFSWVSCCLSSSFSVVSVTLLQRVSSCLQTFVFLTCSAGVFFGPANVFARESAMLKLLQERRKWGESKGAERGPGGGGEREEKTTARKRCENENTP